MFTGCLQQVWASARQRPAVVAERETYVCTRMVIGRQQLGHYSNFPTKEFCTEDVNVFQNYLRMPPDFFDEILERPDTKFRSVLHLDWNCQSVISSFSSSEKLVTSMGTVLLLAGAFFSATSASDSGWSSGTGSARSSSSGGGERWGSSGCYYSSTGSGCAGPEGFIRRGSLVA